MQSWYSRVQQIPLPRGESEISDLEVWVTGDVADRVLMSVRDVYLHFRSTPDANRDVSGIPPLNRCRILGVPKNVKK